MPRKSPILQKHHVLEQQTFNNNDFLQALVDAELVEKDVFENLLYMPADKKLAAVMGVSPHGGGPIKDYQNGITFSLELIEASPDGQAALRGDVAAMQRVAAQVNGLRDTMTIGLVNGDLYTNAPLGMDSDAIRPRTQAFFGSLDHYAQVHASQYGALTGMSSDERLHLLVTRSESRIVTLLDVHDQFGTKLTKGSDLELQRNSLSAAISNAQQSGRIAMSEPGILKVERVLGEEAAYRIRAPRLQQGGITMDLLLGEASTSQLIRSGGLLASGADAVITARRTSQLLEEGNGTAAQSELTHALARNGGGWIGGMATASVIGTSSFVPAAIVAGDALLMSKAFDKGADLLDNRAVYRQTDKADVTWQFNGLNWQREVAMDSTGDGASNPTDRSVGASYDKARELGAKASVVAVDLALGKAPPPQDPFSIPARDGEGRLDNPNWHRDAQTEQWTRQVKTGVSGANDRGVYETQTASPERASELNREAVQRIEHNIAHGKAAIAASYLETRAATRASDFVPLVPEAVEQARAKSDAVLGSDNQLYQRDEAGQWAHAGQTAQGNIALELELTRTIQQPSLEQFNQTIAALEARPLPSAAEVNQNELRHSYYAAGVALTPAWQQAIELATARTREAHGITGPTMQELGPAVEGNAGASRPITHYQVGQDGVARPVATTSTEELRAAWTEVRARAAEQAPVPESPELRIAALSPRERDAYQQALQEANRQGAATVDAGQVAQAAAQHVQNDAPVPSDARDAVADARREEALHRPPASPEPVAATPTPTPTVMTPPAAAPGPEKPERTQQAAQREQSSQREPEVEARPEPRVADALPPIPPSASTTAGQETVKQDGSPQAPAHATLPDPAPAVTPPPEPELARELTDRGADASLLSGAGHEPQEQTAQPVPDRPLPQAERAAQVAVADVRETSPDVAGNASVPAQDALQPAVADRESERPDSVPQMESVASPPEPMAERATQQTDAGVPEVDGAQLSREALPDPTQPGHPDYTLYQQVRQGVEALDARHGRTFDEVSERVTASLLVLAKDNDLERVDHVLASNATRDHPAGHTLFVVQGEPSDPAHHRAATPTELAAQTPVEDSLQQFDAVSREAQQRAMTNQMEQQLEDQRVQHDIQIRAASGG